MGLPDFPGGPPRRIPGFAGCVPCLSLSISLLLALFFKSPSVSCNIIITEFHHVEGANQLSLVPPLK